MRIVLQRVLRAEVRVQGKICGSIGPGYLALIGVAAGDGAADLDYMVRKIGGLRLWPDAAGKMNLPITENGVPPALLAVSQFTLLASTRRGMRPSFDAAAAPELARQLYFGLIAKLRQAGFQIEEGVFQAHMEVESVNSGPVTLVLDSREG